MKKRIVSVFLALSLLLCAAGAQEARWSYVRSVIRGIEMTDDGINWFATVDTYRTPSVTHTEVKAKLQVSSIAGWGTIETQTDKQEDITAGVGGVYSKWQPGKSYRVEVYGYAYNGDKIVETVGPLYAYLNT